MLAKWLVRHGANVNVIFSLNRFAPVHVVASPLIAALLIKAGAKLDGHSSFGTPLQMAAERAWFGDAKKQAIAELIRAAGQPLDLVSALFLKKGEVARKLILANPEAIKTDAGGRTPLDIAAANGDMETAKMLLDAGVRADVGSEMFTDTGGHYTPLVEAVAHHRTEMVRLLCEHGANPNLLGNLGESPNFARLSKGDAEMQEILEQYSAIRHKDRFPFSAK
jgi:ankyrin repeat protein